MDHTNRMTPRKLSKDLVALRTVGIILVSIAVYWVIVINRSPNFLRPMSMILRTGYTIVVPSVFIVHYLAFRVQGWLGNLLSLTLWRCLQWRWQASGWLAQRSQDF